MLIKKLFALAADQDDKTNFLRLLRTVMKDEPSFEDLELMAKINQAHGDIILQAVISNGSSPIEPFKDLEEAAACIAWGVTTPSYPEQ